MELVEYISDMAARKQLAADIGTSPEYLWQIATGWRGKRASKVMALSIERATGGQVPPGKLRPDLFPPCASDQAAQA